MKKIILTKKEIEEVRFYISECDDKTKAENDMIDLIKCNIQLKYNEYIYKLENHIDSYFDEKIGEWVIAKEDYSIILTNIQREVIISALEKLIKSCEKENEEEDFIQDIKIMIKKFDYSDEELECEHHD